MVPFLHHLTNIRQAEVFQVLAEKIFKQSGNMGHVPDLPEIDADVLLLQELIS